MTSIYTKLNNLESSSVLPRPFGRITNPSVSVPATSTRCRIAISNTPPQSGISCHSPNSTISWFVLYLWSLSFFGGYGFNHDPIKYSSTFFMGS